MDDKYTWQEESLESNRLCLRIFKETPVDGVAWRCGYSYPYLVINFSAQIQHFEVTADSSIRYSGIVVPGDFSFLPPQSELAGFYQGSYFSYACITFPQALTSSLFAGSRPLVMRSDPLLLALTWALYRHRNRNDPDAFLYRENLLDTVISHLRFVHLRADHKQKSAVPSLSRLESYVRENLDRKLTVVGLASFLDLSSKSLQRAVRTNSGQSVYSWVTTLRLEHSLELVRNSKLPLAEIATQCGFANQSHWTRLFRRKFGTTPGSLRQ